MSWRPKEGWKENLLKVTYRSVSMEIYDKREVKLGREFFTKGCEVGADAILEALKEKGVYGYMPGEGKGWHTFIPDEE